MIALMATVQMNIPISAEPAAVWEALCDFNAVHERVAAGFVTACEGDGDTRRVTFFNGNVARERLVSVDDARRRLVYSVIETSIGLTHHQASLEVIDAGADGTRLVWTADLLPHAVAPVVEGMMAQGAIAIARTLARGTECHGRAADDR